MRILRMKLYNFRQYENDEIFFPNEGTIGIIGDNGSGKSTILNAIRWVLYGKYDGNVIQKQLKRITAPKNASTYVEMDFKFNNDYFRIRRDLNTSSKRNYVIKNKEEVASGVTNINNYILRLLNMDETTFLYSYYAKQADFDSLIKMNEAPRFQMISKLLNVDTIDIAADNARKKAREVKAYINGLQDFLVQDFDYQKKLDEYEFHKKELTKEQQDLKKELEMIEKKYQEINEKMNKYEEKYNFYIQLKNQLSQLITKYDTLNQHSLKLIENQLSQLLEVEQQYNEIKNIKDVYLKLSKEYSQLNEIREKLLQLDRLKKEYQQQELELDNKLNIFNELDKELKNVVYINLENNINSLTQQIQSLRNQQQNIQNKLFKLRSQIEFQGQEYRKKVNEINQFEQLGTDTPCPVCQRPLGEHQQNQLHHFHKEKAIIEDKIRSIKKDYDIHQEKLNKVQNEENQLNSQLLYLQNQIAPKKQYLQQQLNETQNQINLYRQRLLEKSNEIKNLESSLNTNKEIIQDYSEENFQQLTQKIQETRPIYEKALLFEEKLKEKEELTSKKESTLNQISTLKNEIKKLKEQIEEINFNESEFQKIKEEKSNKQSIKQNLEQQLNKIHFSLDNLEEKIADCTKHINEYKKKENELKEKRKEHSYYLYLDDMLKQYKIDYLNELSPTLSNTMSELIDMLTNGKYYRVELDENFNIFVYKDNEKLPLSMFSEGEKQLIAIVQRLAISRLLSVQIGDNPLDMIILDEVFGSLDNQRQDSLIEMLRGLVHLFPQVIIVSHDENVKDSFEHTLVVNVDKNSNSFCYWKKNVIGENTWNEDEIKKIIEENY